MRRRNQRSTKKNLEDQYLDLLKSHGLPLAQPLVPQEFAETLLEEARASLRSQGVDIEPDADGFLASSTASMQPVLDDLTKDVQGRLSLIGAAIPSPIFVGEFPTGLFNAEIRVAKGGFLTLLLMLIYQSVKLFGLRGTLGTPDDGKFSREEAVRGIIEIVCSYISYTDCRLAGRLPMLGGPRGKLCEDLTRAAETFVIAHEYGHGIAGHLVPERAVEERRGSRSVSVIPTTWEEEYEADDIGTHIMLATLKPQCDHPNHALDAAGAAIFLGLAQLVGTAQDIVFPQGDELPSHPPPSDRSIRQRSRMMDRAGPGIVQIADSAYAWLLEMEPSVLSNVPRRVEELRRTL